MRDIFTIIRKELNRVFKDKKLVLTVILLPGLLIFAMYTIMGSAISSIADEGEGKTYQIVAYDAPAEYTTWLDALEIKYNIVHGEEGTLEANKEKVLNEEIDLIVVFDKNFIASVTSKVSPNVDLYYNPTVNTSSSIYTITSTLLAAFKDKVISDQLGVDDVFTVNNNDPTTSELYKKESMTGRMLGMLLPFLLLNFLFSSAMGVAPESIAGDKERGTMATLLATPIKRSHIAIGKITGLSILAMLSAISSFIGIILSLPKMMGAGNGVTVNIDSYNFGHYAAILLVLIVTVIIIIGLISIVSAFAKNLKESNMIVMPLYFVVLGVGISSMFSQSASTNPFVYLIPLYNSVQSLMAILTFEMSTTNLLITIFSNIAYITLLVLLLSKMFKSEKIMFSK